MDPLIVRSLNDKLYDKRKIGALEVGKLMRISELKRAKKRKMLWDPNPPVVDTDRLERQVRDCLANGDHAKIRSIIDQLCHEFAYAVHQSQARNGGLIGLAAVSIALGADVARYLEEIVPPVLACFEDQDARVRYYACESMYNIAKVAKGEILLFFNEVFDSLCKVLTLFDEFLEKHPDRYNKLTADSELSVKNGAELLDRLVKDIVAESAATYVSVLQSPRQSITEDSSDDPNSLSYSSLPTAFSLQRFVPLLVERIHVLNPFTRQFLVSWIVLLDGIPDLELVTYLPAFLPGLFNFLSDPNQDVHEATEVCLEGFLSEIKRIARVKRGIAESRRSRDRDNNNNNNINSNFNRTRSRTLSEAGSAVTDENKETFGAELSHESTFTGADSYDSSADGSWVPGQDVQVDHTQILEILMPFLDSRQEELQRTGFRWIDNFFEICPDEMLAVVPRLLTLVLPAISHDFEAVRDSARKVNSSLLNLIMSLPGEVQDVSSNATAPTGNVTRSLIPPLVDKERRDSTTPKTASQTNVAEQPEQSEKMGSAETAKQPELDYAATVNALTLQFLNEHEETRVVALDWLIMLHKKAHKKILAINDGTFPALLKTLSDPSEAVITRDLQLLSQISHNSEDDYFASFMVNLLTLFSTDRRLLETRGNLIIRQLCTSLNPERIYRTLAEILEKDEDVEFASTMIQILNNNLITAPELHDLRKRLRSLDTKDGQTFFVTLFKSWCHNAVATFSLCLLAQAYEQASNLLQLFADLEITVNLLVQIDKLVQLLESPVFTYLRLQLLEPEKYPFLYKCLYGLLMLLPQSSAFAALKNRLNSVSAIGYLHIAPRTQPPNNTYEPRNRLKPRAENEIKWIELLEKFRSVQEKARRTQSQYSKTFLGGNSATETTNSMAAAVNQPLPRVPTPSGASQNLSIASNTAASTKTKSSLGISKLGGAAVRRIRR